MKTKKIFLLFIFFTLFLSILPNKVSADADESSLPSVTVINPIRGPQLGLEKADLLKSLKGQWHAVASSDIPATWLWQYSALEDKTLVDFAKSEMENQEFGIFLEIDRNSADKAGVVYHSAGPWYFSDGLLLVSYEQFEREKLIDNVFKTFKENFGYYPKTVGAWWVGAESITYMQKKYGITAVLQCADQFSTDRYSLWGTPWSIPYAPSERNAAIPASSRHDRIPNVVILQWATRDPVMAYGPGVENSIYSIQDKGNIAYIAYLKNIFLRKPLDHIAIGLESGFTPEGYAGQYQEQMQALKKWEKEGSIILQKTSAYAEDFNKQQNVLPPTSYFLTTGYETTDQAFWYHSPAYRFGIQKKGNNIYVIDVRDYFATPTEEFYTLPNTQPMIRINTNGVIDTIRFPGDKILLGRSEKPLVMKEVANQISLSVDGKLLAQFTPSKVSYTPLATDNETKTMSFSHLDTISIGGIILFIAIVYVAFIFSSYKRKPDHAAVSIFCFLLLVTVLSPIITSGQFSGETMFFTTQSLSLLPYFAFLPIPPGLKVALLLQIFPLILILIFHYIVTKRLRIISLLTVTVIVSLVILFFLNSFESFFRFITDFFIVGKKAKLLIIASLAAIAFFVFFLIRLYRTKKEKLLLFTLIIFALFLVSVSRNQLFAEKNFIITPFELAALETVFNKQKPVVYLQPEKSTPYQRVWPVLTQDKKYVEALTTTTWEVVPQKEVESIISDKKDNLIFIPKYLGTDLFSIEDSIGESKKIFDNGQIGILEKE